MRINELFETAPNLDRVYAQAQRLAPRKRDPEKIAANKAYLQKRKDIENKLAPLAKQAESEQTFISAANHHFSPEDIKMVHLPTIFKMYNDTEAQKNIDAWTDYGNQRAAGKIQGKGPGGLKNWTGD